MYRQVTRQPFCPGTFPFRQQRERPLQRAEYRQHTEQYLLAVDRRPPAYAEHDKGNQHDDFVYSHDDTGRQGGEPQFRGILFHAGHFIHTGLLHGRLDKVGV